MLLIRLWRWLCGWVEFTAEGGAPGRLLALAAREGVPLWNTRRQGATLIACCYARQYRALRPLVRRCGLRMRVRTRHGAAFWLNRYHARWGLVAGAALYVGLLIGLSGFIWSVDIRGLEHADAGALNRWLSQNGVVAGGRKSTVDLVQLQMDALRDLPDISWLAVNLDGCIAEVEVREIGHGEAPAESTAPSNLVATRDGVIISMTVTGGESVVQVGDAVAKGGLLVSGVTATDRGTLVRHSAGKVIAETTRHITIEVPLEEPLPLPCGTPRETLTLHLFGLPLPLSDSDLTTNGCRVEEFERAAKLGGVTLPLALTMRRYTPQCAQLVRRTEQEALALAETRLAEKETADLKEVEVKERHVAQAVENGAVVLRADYTCLENIAEEISIRMDDPQKPVFPEK